MGPWITVLSLSPMACILLLLRIMFCFLYVLIFLFDVCEKIEYFDFMDSICQKLNAIVDTFLPALDIIFFFLLMFVLSY